MPSVLLSDVGADIQRSFPQVQWISSEGLHVSKPRVEHSWQRVDEASFRRALLDAILAGDTAHGSESTKTLVFAGETASADSISQMLKESGVHHVVYHKNRPSDERTAALEYMSSENASSSTSYKVNT